MMKRTMNQTGTFRISPVGPYSLAESASFLCGFTPGKGGAATLDDGRLVLGFLDESRYVPVTVAIGQDDSNGDVVCEIAGSPRPEHVGPIKNQVMRVLSLDRDARGLAEIGSRDAVVRELLEGRPGFRPVAFPSPYEAAVWGILVQRISMAVAARMKERLAVATGTIANGFGRDFHPAPSPARLLELRTFPGIAEEKLVRLQAVAVAALEGKLDAARIRSLSHEEAIASLREIRGIGPWTAEHIVTRGTGALDELPTSEPRVMRAIAEVYGLKETPTVEEATHIAESWRPYRMWIAILAVMKLSQTPRWNGPGLRAARGRVTPPKPRPSRRSQLRLPDSAA